MEKNTDAASIVRGMISDYLRKYRHVSETASPAAGLFGFGASPKNDSCHSDFLESLAAFTGALTDISPEEANAVVSAVIDMALDKTQPDSCHWVFIAAERTVFKLITGMLPEDKALLLCRYEKEVPRLRRLPVEKELIKALKG